MVSKELISKIISDSILSVKCKLNRIGINSLNNFIKHTMNVFHEDTKGLDHEEGIVIASDGEVIDRVVGGKNSISRKVINTESYLSRQFGDFCFDHNHPVLDLSKVRYGENTPLHSCLSDGDVRFLIHKETVNFNGEEITLMPFKSITCECGANDSRMTLTRVKGDSFNNPLMNDKGGELRSNFLNTHNVLQKAYLSLCKRYENIYGKESRKWIAENPVSNFNSFEEYVSARDKYLLNWGKDFIQRDFEWNNSLNFAITEFEKLGFELSMEYGYLYNKK